MEDFQNTLTEYVLNENCSYQILIIFVILLSPQDPLEQYGISDETRFQVNNGLQLMRRDTSSL